MNRLIQFATRVFLAMLRWRARRVSRRLELVLLKLGTGYGGWVVVNGVLNSSSICVSVGCGEDISFDVEVANRYGSRVALFDPTPRSIAHVEDVLTGAAQGRRVAINKSPTEFYELRPDTPSRLRFHPVAVSASSGTIRLYMPTRSDFVSCSILADGMSEEYIDVPSITLEEAVRVANLDGGDVDLVKMDIEGAERDVLAQYLSRRSGPKLLCIELDGFSSRLIGLSAKWPTISLLRLLRPHYRLVAVDDLNCTFLRRDVRVSPAAQPVSAA